MSDKIYIGQNKANFEPLTINGSKVLIDEETFFKIENVDQMRPFFMSVVSDSNHWMFISSNGALSAGRKDCDSAIFPYYTDDKITESVEITGSKTLFQVRVSEKTFLWEPFSNKYTGVYNITRNLYKNQTGNKIVFEEINHDLGLRYSYQWNTSNIYGFVKKSNLQNISSEPVNIQVLDGLQNLMPYGVSADMQNTRSNLVDAYKKSELDADTGIGIFALSAIIVDKAEPSEALKATIAWSFGLDTPTYLLSSLQLDKFRRGLKISEEIDVRAEKGAYFLSSNMSLRPNKSQEWFIVANVNQSLVSINQLIQSIKQGVNLQDLVLKDVALGTKKLIELAAASDGLQFTKDDLINTRHFSNTLFNIMRGGVFDDNYNIEKSDLLSYLNNANKMVVSRHQVILENLPTSFSLQHLKSLISDTTDPVLKRLCIEYMPLKFSRRHGDPSRPWNKFSINTRSEIDGSKILDYEGNWRDIFQNWEALVHSYPEFIESMIFKFLNASTFEGYNPYRVTKDGFDWEVIEPNDPWSYIGYWGDHQIIYLQKFLEIIEAYYPKKLANYLNQRIFVYANVPYKIKSYEAILENPKDTITFDEELDKKIHLKKTKIGVDGALLTTKDDEVYNVNLLEKLLATTLAKISNFIPEAGIWLNTQRPEWNDANNALVGNGVSMVTTYYLRRFLNFFKTIIEESSYESLEVSEELSVFFNSVLNTLNDNQQLLTYKISDRDRKCIVDALGSAGSNYRTSIYSKGFSGNQISISKSNLVVFCQVSLQFLDHSIKANKRVDHLYHGYNLISITEDNEIAISYLPVMLEGQTAVLSSGALSPQESLNLLDNLKRSSLLRADQDSYVLYPDKELLRFTDKNCIPPELVQKSTLLKQLLNDGNTQVIEKDVLGQYHFNGSFNNSGSLKNALSELSGESYQNLVAKESTQILEIFESVFDHKSFTGRSGTFFGYEGLGSIYWHMVSKLVLAIQETYISASKCDVSENLLEQLQLHYYESSYGIGVHKSPEVYGAFPTDPYSHTPANKGAQQPGMTGQVKEDLLSRFGELGVSVKGGQLHFKPRLLRKNEFFEKTQTIVLPRISKNTAQLELDKNSLCFTICQTPIIYTIGTKNQIEIHYLNQPSNTVDKLNLDSETSTKIFRRTGEIELIKVTLKESEF